MLLLKKLLNTSIANENLAQTCHYVLNYYGIKNTITSLDSFIDEHLENPSILALMDSLSRYGIDNAAIRKGDYEYKDFELPFVCSIQRPSWSHPYFTVVTAIDENNVTYFDPIEKDDRILPIAEFDQIDKDIILLLDATDPKPETDYAANKKKEKNKLIARGLYVSVIAIVFFFILVYNFLSVQYPLNWIGTLFFLFTIVGCLTSLILVWHEVDSHNPFIKKVCGGQGGKIDCEAVLSSKGASFMGISWSIIGFSYFTTILLSQLLFGPSNITYLPYWLGLSLLAFPYVIYSIYYQWKIVGQWCTLCLTIQAVIGLSAGIALGYMYQYGGNIPPTYIPFLTLLLIGAIVLSLTSFTIPLLKTAKESRINKIRWKQLRYNPDIFNMLLRKESFVSQSAEGLGIVIGNPNAKHEIIKVCNPYCGPCAKAHPELEELINSNPNIKVRIIFTATGLDNDIRTAPVQHLLAIQERDGREIVRNALDSWYMSDTKDYVAFANKFPVNGLVTQQGEKINAMGKWCDHMKIRATPTFFINGYELPDSYQIGELKHIFKETT